jgi:hypothetical protein
LKEEGLVDRPEKKPIKKLTKPRFFERARPNQMWQSDIFTFRLGGRAAYLIGYIDDYSRYIVGLGLYRSQTAEHVLEVYRKAIGEYGVPKEMLTDQGRQYVNWRGKTRFQAELKKERVAHIKSRPHHPMTLGKIERFWKTIFEEFLSRVQFDSFEEAEERLKLWVKYYNHKRPHQGIKGLCPAERFFEVATELKTVLERGIEANVLETALRGQPKQPFYMVGRMGDQSVVIRAEKGKVRMMLDGEKKQDNQELVYEMKESGDEQDREIDGGKEPTGVQCQREMRSGSGGVEREEEACGSVPGTGGQVDLPGAVAEQGARSDDGGVGTVEEGADGAGAGPETGEAPGEDNAATGEGVEAGAEAGNSPKEGRQGGRIGTLLDMRDDEVILLTRDQVPKVVKILREMEEDRERRWREQEQGGTTGAAEGGDDPEGAQRADDGNGSGESSGDESEDVLQVGEESARSDDGGAERSPLRATVAAGRWPESGLGEEAERDGEAVAAGRGEGPDPDVYG